MVLDLSSVDDYIVNFTEALHKAAEETLTALDPAQKRSYISEDTWKLIQGRQTCREKGEVEKEKTFTAQIKEKATEDHKQYQIVELEKAGTLKERWQGVNSHRKTFTPKFNQQVDMNGQRIKFGKRAEATAEYLAEKQWGNQNHTEPKINPLKSYKRASASEMIISSWQNCTRS